MSLVPQPNQISQLNLVTARVPTPSAVSVPEPRHASTAPAVVVAAATGMVRVIRVVVRVPTVRTLCSTARAPARCPATSLRIAPGGVGGGADAVVIGIVIINIIIIIAAAAAVVVVIIGVVVTVVAAASPTICVTIGITIGIAAFGWVDGLEPTARGTVQG
ncbi:hypothetical protein UCDDA912_g10132 [Diaporthe ampelina]|uniref:Uncharacterized protein n=1 Tax=Diaporthe ampelina TaxID=1214573 RepID=A0A0G2F6V3_9PEZI|nr:hypothetical protein UCDDA912_g10132 [Diaporthe ampelina]